MSVHKIIAAGIIAGVYIVLAIGLVRADRQTHTGGFISLQGMLSGLVTLPVTFLLEYCGHRINFRSNVEMGAAILGCAALFFLLTFGVVAFADYIWNWTPAQR